MILLIRCLILIKLKKPIIMLIIYFIQLFNQIILDDCLLINRSIILFDPNLLTF